ncbi:hypothetical protein OS493_038510, partial [Desmophyllum pertusum]
MADQSRPIPVNNEEVVEIIQAVQPNVDNATNNPVSEAASAFFRPGELPTGLAGGFTTRFYCLAVVREQRGDLDIRPTQGGEAFRYKVRPCTHRRGVAMCPTKRCGCVPTKVAVCPPKRCGCVPTEEVWLCAHQRGVAVWLLGGVTVCTPKRCGCVPTKRCGCVPTQEVRLCSLKYVCVLSQEVWLCALRRGVAMCLLRVWLWAHPRGVAVSTPRSVAGCPQRCVAASSQSWGWVPTKMSGGVFTEVWLWAHKEMWLCAHNVDVA